MRTAAVLATSDSYAKLRRQIVQWLSQCMPQVVGEDRIIFHLCADEPFELDALGDAFAGLAAQYEKLLHEHGLSGDAAAKLIVTDVRTGSITLEIGYPALALYGAYDGGLWVSLARETMARHTAGQDVLQIA